MTRNKEHPQGSVPKVEDLGRCYIDPQNLTQTLKPPIEQLKTDGYTQETKGK